MKQYEIFDARNTNLLVNNDTTIRASSARQALQSYLNNRNEGNIKFHNTADNDVMWRTQPIVERGDRRYRDGRVSWWGINLPKYQPIK